jgi:hypothetical protein
MIGNNLVKVDGIVKDSLKLIISVESGRIAIPSTAFEYPCVHISQPTETLPYKLPSSFALNESRTTVPAIPPFSIIGDECEFTTQRQYLLPALKNKKKMIEI